MSFLTQLWSTLTRGEDETGTLPQAGSLGRAERVRVFVTYKSDDAETIGYLEEQPEHFLFRYADEYRRRPGAVPISAFPDLGRVYQSKDLWPFFAVRLPPAHRPDVRELIESKNLTTESTLRRLVELSPRTISNPYRFEMAS